MPGGDGTGPMGRGPLTGRGLGYCAGGYPRYGLGRRAGFGARGYGLGLGYRRGYRAYYPVEPVDPRTERELLEEERAVLENRLKMVSRELEGLSDDGDK